MYADDTNVTFSAATIPEFQVNSDLKYIDRWLKANTLSLNVAKIDRVYFYYQLEAETTVLK